MANRSEAKKREAKLLRVKIVELLVFDGNLRFALFSFATLSNLSEF